MARTVWRTVRNREPLRSYPESEMRFFRTIYGVQLTFIKDDKEGRGEIALVIVQQLLRK